MPSGRDNLKPQNPKTETYMITIIAILSTSTNRYFISITLRHTMNAANNNDDKDNDDAGNGKVDLFFGEARKRNNHRRPNTKSTPRTLDTMLHLPLRQIRQEGEDNSSYHPNEIHKEAIKAPRVIPITQPANLLASPHQTKFQSKQQQ